MNKDDLELRNKLLARIGALEGIVQANCSLEDAMQMVTNTIEEELRPQLADKRADKFMTDTRKSFWQKWGL